MSKKRTKLEQSLRDLNVSVDELRDALFRYKKANVQLERLIHQGVPAIEALERVGAPTLRPELTEALNALASARHDGRVGLFAVASEDGATMSEVGRALKFSRQLASRLASEDRG